ncbi:MAG: potassium-transporting ATPase subunit KdpA [Bryobacteraceae bacterium]
MISAGMLQLIVFFVVLLALTKPLGAYMAKVFQGERTPLSAVLRPLERVIYRLSGIEETEEQRWTQYTAAVLAFSVAGFLFTYLFQRLQGLLPLNPMRFDAGKVSPDLAFNTAMSFVTNTNWQSYTPEATLSYLAQMAALAVQNFASAAAGIAIAIALVRGLVRQQMKTIGNFWVDMTRAAVYVLLPLSIAGALFLVSQGVIQNFHGYANAKTLEGVAQVIPQGPVASQEAIKMIGTNGGGFFNANSAHPYENPTPLSNFVEMLMIFTIPAGLTYTFGKMAGDTRQGWALFAAMSVLFLAGVAVCWPAEQSGNPLLAKLGVESSATAGQTGGNMEGKEARFGIAASALFAVITTDASCGAVNAMHDSLTPLGGLAPLFNIHLGEVVFGGVGAGLYGILLFAILAVFIAGLMVGRTPEYLGKKIEQKEVKMAMLALIATAFAVLVFTGISAVAHFDENGYWNAPGVLTANLNNGGPHGFSELLYAYSSSTANNGSAFAGLNANTPWYNLTIGVCMLTGRFLFLIPLLAVAGSLAMKKKIPATSGTFPTHGALFAGLLVGTIVIVGALTFFPSLSLGPIVEHFLMHGGRLFSSLPAGIWS